MKKGKTVLVVVVIVLTVLFFNSPKPKIIEQEITIDLFLNSIELFSVVDGTPADGITFHVNVNNNQAVQPIYVEVVDAYTNRGNSDLFRNQFIGQTMNINAKQSDKFDGTLTDLSSYESQTIKTMFTVCVQGTANFNGDIQTETKCSNKELLIQQDPLVIFRTNDRTYGTGSEIALKYTSCDGTSLAKYSRSNSGSSSASNCWSTTGTKLFNTFYYEVPCDKSFPCYLGSYGGKATVCWKQTTGGVSYVGYVSDLSALISDSKWQLNSNMEVLCPTCTDGKQNQKETDIDCGGTICSKRCELGEYCLINSDCSTDNCEGGVCGDYTYIKFRTSSLSYNGGTVVDFKLSGGNPLGCSGETLIQYSVASSIGGGSQNLCNENFVPNIPCSLGIGKCYLGEYNTNLYICEYYYDNGYWWHSKKLTEIGTASSISINPSYEVAC